MKLKKVNAQASFPLLNRLGLLLHAGFPVHALSFSSRQLPLPAKKDFLFHPRGSHFHALTLCNFGGIHGSIFQEALGSQAFSGLFFRASHFECLMHPLDTRLTPGLLGKSMGVVALKAHYRSFPLSPVLTLFPQTFLDHPLRGADLSWRFPVLSYGDLRLGLDLPTNASSFNRLPAISVTFSAAEGRATSPIWPVKNLAYPPRFMATGSAKAAPQTDSSSSERADSPLQSQDANDPLILRFEPETRPLQEALDRNHGIRSERATRDEEQNGSGLVDGYHDLTGSPPEVTSSRKIKAIEELIRSLEELRESLELKRLECCFTEDGSFTMKWVGEEGILPLFTPFEKQNLTAEEIWQALNTQQSNSDTLFQALACDADEGVWYKLIAFSNETGKQTQFFESFTNPTGGAQLSPLRLLSEREFTENFWISLLCLAKPANTKKLWDALIKEEGSNKSTPLYWLARNGGKGILTQLIHSSEELGTQGQLWQSLITVQGLDKASPLYWLARNGGEGILTQLLHFVQGPGIQAQLWEGLITVQGNDKSTPLHWLARNGGEGILTQLLHLAQGLGAQAQLWEVLTKVERSDQSPPLYSLTGNGGGRILTQFIQFAEELGTQAQLWQSLITGQGKDKTTLLYELTRNGGEVILGQFIDFSQRLGTTRQLWEGLITVQGLDKAAPLYRLIQYGGGEALTQLINIAQELGTQEQLWQSLNTGQGFDKAPPLYWLTRNGGGEILTQLIHFAEELGIQEQLWQSLLTVQGHYKTTPLYSLTQNRRGALTELIHFAQETEKQNQLWEGLITVQGHYKTTPLYRLAQNGGEGILTELIHFAEELGTQAQLWQSLITVQGLDKATPLYWLTKRGGEGILTQLIHFAQGLGTQTQLWEGLITVQGNDKTTPLYWLTKDGEEGDLTQLIHFAEETGTQDQLWEGLLKACSGSPYPLDGAESFWINPIHFFEETGTQNQLWEGLPEASSSNAYPLDEAESFWINPIHFFEETGTQNQLWEGLPKASSSNAYPLDGAEMSWTNLIGLAGNSEAQELWGGLTKAVNHFRTIPLYWLAQMWSQTPWTKLIELVNEKHQVKLCSALDLLVKIQLARDIGALLPPKQPAREQGRQQLTQQERLLQAKEKILFGKQEKIASELNRITPRYDAFIDAILALPAMYASPMLDGAGFHFYFHYDSLNEGTIPYGALEMLLRLALNPGASDQIRDKILKIHNIHAQHHKTLKEILPPQKDDREVSQKADQGKLHGALKAMTGCNPAVAWLYGNLSKQGKLWPTFIELLNLKLPQQSFEMSDHTERSSLYQSIATQRPYFGETLRKLLGDSFNPNDRTTQPNF